MPRTVLDVTRLLNRASHPVATGIDRVELAYARRALTLPEAQLGFAAIVRRRVVPLPQDAVGRFIAALDAKWRVGRGDDTAARLLFQRLGAEAPTAPETERAADEASRRSLGLRAAAFQTLTRAAVQDGDVYVHVSHSRLDRPEAFAGVRRRGARIVVLVHDLIPIRFPEYGRDGEKERHVARMTTALDHAATLITNSIDTADDLEAFAREIDRRPPPIIPAPLGVEVGFDRAAKPLGAAHPYFVALGTIEPRKNHLLLLHLWRRLAARLGDATPTLVLVGRRGWENEMVLDLLERAPAIGRHVVETNDLPDSALASLVKGARALLFPSFAEGYGLPLAEALALGAPAVVSDLPVFREIAGDAVERLDPLDGLGWERAVIDFLDDGSGRRQAALRATERYEPPSWNAHFDLVAEATGLR